MKFKKTPFIPDTLEGHWEVFKNRFLEKYPNLTDEDLDYRHLGFENMFNQLSAKTGTTRDQLRDEIINWDEGPINH